MMIDLTVKTLDSQNHTFSLNDDITVRQFKEHIAETVSIAADLQRLIYCGRVLQDEKLLNEYDVNGKVIHLVQRAPPSSTQRSSNTPPNSGHGGDWPSGPRIRYGQAQFHGSPMVVGSVSIPADVIEGYEWPSIPQLTTTLARGHLSVVRRMLNQANCVIDRLDDSGGTGTPPSTSTQSTESDESKWTEAGSSATSTSATNPASSQKPDEVPTTSQQPSTSATNQEPITDAMVLRALSELLKKLLTTQDRLRPFIRETIDMASETATSTSERTTEESQRIIDGVAECFHLISHAQHALSNLSINMQQSAPRTLRCRPLLIQPSAILQAGLPIQVEAHISLHGQNESSPEGEEGREGTNPTTRTSSERASTPPATARAANSEPPTTQAETRPTAPTAESADGFNVFNFPNNVEVVMEMGPQTPRVWSFSTNADQNQGNNNNNNNTANNNNNSSNASASNGSMNWSGPTPDMIRNLMQVVAGYMTQTGVVSTSAPAPTSTTINPASLDYLRRRAVLFPVGSDSNGSSGQDSHIRGNTETHPTTSTQTRTTSRTHVIHQQALGVGMGLPHSLEFDPFLACNSHHIRRRQPQAANTAASTQTGQNTTSTESTVAQEDAGASAPRANESLAESINAARIVNSKRGTSFQSVLTTRGIGFREDRIPRTDDESGMMNLRGILFDVYDVLSKVLTIDEWDGILSGDSSKLTRAASDFRRKVICRFGIEASDILVAMTQEELIREFKPFIERTFEGINATHNGRTIDLCATVNRIIHIFSMKYARAIFCFREPSTAELAVTTKTLIENLKSILSLCLQGETEYERIMTRFATELTQNTPKLFRDWVLGGVTEWFFNYSRSIPSLPESQIISLLRYKKDGSRQVAATSSEVRNLAQSGSEPMEIDAPSNDRPSSDPLQEDGEEVPTTFPGHENILPDWVPIIARDGTRQRRQLQLGLADGNVTTLSDAYLATMPSKRRKIVEQQKPSLASPTPNHMAIPSSMERLVRESVGRAGFEEVDGAVSALVGDPSVRRAFGQAIRESLNPRRYQTPDFPDPLRFPNATKFFNDRPPEQ